MNRPPCEVISDCPTFLLEPPDRSRDMRRMGIIAAAAGCIVLASSGLFTARAEFYDKKTLTIVVNYGTGGNADLSARIFQNHLRTHLSGATLVVQNMPGAGGAL